MTTDATGGVAWARQRWTEQGFPDPAHFTAMGSVLRTAVLVGARVDAALKPLGLSRRAYLLLVALDVAPERTQSLGRLGRTLLVHPTTATTVVEQLAASGAVRRTPHPDDRRATLVTMSDEGLRLVRAAQVALADIGFGMPGTSEAQAEAVTAALAPVRLALGDED
jgi:DNA-binding MarR family transcriptional regulator